MGLAETLDQLLGLVIALIVYAVIRWVQHRWPDPPGVSSREKPEKPPEGG